MTKVSKVVRFYRPMLIDENDVVKPFPPGFWKALRKLVEQLDRDQRRIPHSGSQYRGESAIGTSPALRYFRVGRLRAAADWPDVVDDLDVVTPLQVRGKLLENAYMVPFGGEKNQIAVMNPIRGLVPLTAIESWISHMLELPMKGQSVELQPIVDQKVLKKLKGAEAVASLKVRIPYDRDLDLPDSGSVVQNAIAGVQEAANDELDVEVKFSFGRRTPTRGMGKKLQKVAEALAASGGPDKIDVSLVLEDGDGFKREHHDLLRDEIAESAVFWGDADHQFSVDEILEAMSQAITAFRKR